MLKYPKLCGNMPGLVTIWSQSPKLLIRCLSSPNLYSALDPMLYALRLGSGPTCSVVLTMMSSFLIR